LGSLLPLWLSRFPVSLCGFFSDCRPPAPFSNWVHPPVSFCSPAECYRSVPAPSLQNDEDAFLGVPIPLRDINRRRHIWSATPTSQTVPSSAFRTPSTVSSATGLAGLFHPAATFRVRSPGVSSPDEAVPSRRRPVPSCRWRLPAVARLPVRHHEPAPRLQGLLFIGIRCSAVGV